MGNKPSDKSRDWRTVIAGWFSFAYILAVAGIMYLRWPDTGSMNLVAWGAFLGGVGSPLALLWLVLGYYQNREELKQNTKALHLQRHEMAAQVEALSRQANILEQQYIREGQPEFHFRALDTSPVHINDEQSSFSYDLENSKARATDIAFQSLDSRSGLHPDYIVSLGTNRKIQMTIYVPSTETEPDYLCDIRMTYIDVGGRQQERLFRYQYGHIVEIDSSMHVYDAASSANHQGRVRLICNGPDDWDVYWPSQDLPALEHSPFANADGFARQYAARYGYDIEVTDSPNSKPRLLLNDQLNI